MEEEIAELRRRLHTPDGERRYAAPQRRSGTPPAEASPQATSAGRNETPPARPADPALRREPAPRETVRFVRPDPAESPESKPAGNAVEKGVALRAFIWLGGLAMIFAGFFLVKESIERGLFTPAMRTASGGAFAAALGVCAEIFRKRGANARIACSLMGAAVAVAYGTIYAASQFYALIPGPAAVAGLALTSIFALFASKKYGWQMGLLALLGAFCAPILISTENASSPALLAYLFMMTSAMLCVFYRQRKENMALLLLGANALWAVLWIFLFLRGQDDLWVYHAWLAASSFEFAAFGVMARRQTGKGWQTDAESLLNHFTFMPMLGTATLIFVTSMAGPCLPSGDTSFIRLLPFLLYSAAYFAGALAFGRMRKTLWLLTLASSVLAYEFLGGEYSWQTFAIFAAWTLLSLAAICKSGRPAGFCASLGFSVFFASTLSVPGSHPYADIAVRFGYAAILQCLCAIRFVRGDGAAKTILGIFSAMAFIAFLFTAILFEKFALMPAILLFYIPALLWQDNPPLRRNIALFAPLLLIFYAAMGGIPMLGYAVFGERPLGGMENLGISSTLFFAAVCAALAVILQIRRPGGRLAGLMWVCTLVAAIFAALYVLLALFPAGAVSEYLRAALAGCLPMLAALGALRIAKRFSLGALSWVAAAFLLLGFLRFTLAAFSAQNPFSSPMPVAGVPILNAFAVSLLLPSAIMFAAMRIAPSKDEGGGILRTVFFICGLLLAFMWVNSQVTFAFRGGSLCSAPGHAEFYAYSAAWIAWAIFLLGLGFVRKSAALRVSSLIFAGAASIKVFIFDTSELDGLLRAVSFAMLGACLIGIGWFYMRHIFRDEDTGPKE